MSFDVPTIPSGGAAAGSGEGDARLRCVFSALAISALAAGMSTSVAGAADLLVPAEFGSIQAAIDAAAEGDRVLVAAGAYHGQVDLRGKGIQLLSVDGAAVTAIDGGGTQSVIVGHGEPETCLVRGFTICNGRDHGYHNGGGVKLTHSSARFSDCRFVDNRAEQPGWWGGGAWRSEHGNPIIERCVFVGNYGGGNVAGVYHYLGGGISISDCVFQDNVAASGQCIHIQTEGGTITAAIRRCTFRRYEGHDPGAGCFPVAFWNPYGGTINCTIEDCVAEEPIWQPGTDSSAVTFMAIGAYPNSTYHLVLSGIRTCGVPSLVYSDSYSPWIDAGGHSMSAECCPADVNRDGLVDGGDLGSLLRNWGACVGCQEDLNGDAQVDGADLGMLMAGWGACP